MIDLGQWRRLGRRLHRRIRRRLPARPTDGVPAASHLASVIETATEYDMVADLDEQYYELLYEHWITAELDGRFHGRSVRLLDLGCGHGRLSLPLARWCSPKGGEVVGVDLAPSALTAARAYARDRGLTNVTFIQGDVLRFASETIAESVDVILLLEVSFILPSFQETLREIARILRPEGVLFLATRSQYYNLLQAVRARSWDDAGTVIREREGRLFGGPTFMTWQTPEDIRSLLTPLGLAVTSQRGIGVCSGIAGDPLAAVVRPSRLSALERARLMQIEQRIAAEYVSCGRYILSIALKTGGNGGDDKRCSK